METHQHGQLAWPTVEADWIFVKSFLKQISVRETLKTLRSKDLLPLSQPVKAFRICTLFRKRPPACWQDPKGRGQVGKRRHVGLLGCFAETVGEISHG